MTNTARACRKLVSTAVTATLLLTGIAVAGTVTRMIAPAASPGHDTLMLRSSVAPGLAPGTSRSVTLTVSNAGPSDVAITAVRLVRVTADDAHPHCVTEDFTMEDVPQSGSVPSGTRDVQLASGTLAYENTDVNQDACKAATLTLTLSSTRA